MTVKNLFKTAPTEHELQMFSSLITAIIQLNFKRYHIRYWSAQDTNPVNCGYGRTLCEKPKDVKLLFNLTYPKTISLLPDGGGTNMMLLPHSVEHAITADIQQVFGKRIRVEFYTSGLTQDEYAVFSM